MVLDDAGGSHIEEAVSIANWILVERVSRSKSQAGQKLVLAADRKDPNAAPTEARHRKTLASAHPCCRPARHGQYGQLDGSDYRFNMNAQFSESR